MSLIDKIKILKNAGKIQKFAIYADIIDLSKYDPQKNIYNFFQQFIEHLEEYLSYDSKPSDDVKKSSAACFKHLFSYIQISSDQDKFHKYLTVYDKYSFLIEDIVEQAEIYQSFGYLFWLTQDMDASKKYLIKSLELINQTDINTIPGRYTNLGFIYEYTGDYQTAQEYYDQGLKFAQRTHYQQAIYNAYNALGRLFYHLALYEKARDYFQAAIDLLDIDSRNPSLISAIMNLASTYVFLKQYDLAIECLKKVQQDWLKDIDPELYYSSYINMAIYYKEMGELSKSEKANAIVLDYALKNNNSELLFGYYHNQAVLQNEQKKFAEAVISGKKALDICSLSNNPKQQALALKLLARSYMDSRDYDNALTYFNKSVKIARKNHDDPELINMLDDVAECHAKKSNFENAYKYRCEFDKLREKIRKIKEKEEALLNKKQVVKSGKTSHFIFKNGYSLISKELNEKIGIPLIGHSPEMQKVVQKALLIAGNNNASVLLRGESGTGKELIARLIHFASDRSTAPFVPVNSASFTTELAQSALFGHDIGAFTGAVKLHKGFFEQADSGTIFLDEIADMSLDIQASILRVLECKIIRRLGSDKPVDTNFRLISATNSDISELVENKIFRLDLLNRINTLEIVIPPLRDRLDDLPLLIDYYMQDISQKLNKKQPEMEAAVIKALLSYDYPGNIREFVNIMEKLIIFCKDNYIAEEDLSFLNFNRKCPKNEDCFHNLNLKENEQLLLNLAMKKCKNSQKEAAKLLGIPPYTLSRKLKKYNS